MVRDRLSGMQAVPVMLLALTLTLGGQQGAPAALSGTVVDHATGLPLAEVIVTASSGSPRVSQGTLTDSQGRFVFVGLPPSRDYRLSANRQGYTGDALLQDTFRQGVRLSLAPEQWRAGLVLQLRPLGSISGRVVDERGDPIVATPVRSWVRSFVAGRPRWVAGPHAQTDDRGVYRIHGLLAATYVIHVPSALSVVPASTPLGHLSGLSAAELAARRMDAPRVASVPVGDVRLVLGPTSLVSNVDGRHHVYTQRFHPSAASMADAIPIDLRDGEHREVSDLVMQPERTVHVRGRVIGPPDVVNGILVRLLPAGSELDMDTGATVATATAKADGTFLLVGVPAGSYTAVASTRSGELSLLPTQPSALSAVPGRTPGSRSIVTMGDRIFVGSDDAGRTSADGRADVIVAATPVEDLVIPLSSGSVVEGRIVSDDGSPLPDGLRVWIESADGTLSYGRIAATAEPEGPSSSRFRFSSVPDGRFFLRVSEVAARVKTIRGVADFTTRPLVIGNGTPASGLVVTMTRERAVLRGPVLDTMGAPSTGAAVMVFPADPMGWTRYGLSPRRVRSLIAAEEYEITTLPAGEYLVIAVDVRDESRWREPAFLARAARLAERVRLDWGGVTVATATVREVPDR